MSFVFSVVKWFLGKVSPEKGTIKAWFAATGKLIYEGGQGLVTVKKVSYFGLLRRTSVSIINR